MGELTSAKRLYIHFVGGTSRVMMTMADCSLGSYLQDKGGGGFSQVGLVVEGGGRAFTTVVKDLDLQLHHRGAGVALSLSGDSRAEGRGNFPASRRTRQPST